MVLFTASRGNTFVGGTNALPCALRVYCNLYFIDVPCLLLINAFNTLNITYVISESRSRVDEDADGMFVLTVTT